jgi:S-adenosylmethionine decarboxylase
LKVVSRQFKPQGVTVLALLSESHASIHTYPEVGAAFVDVFTCGTRANPALAVQLLADTLGAQSGRVNKISRGVQVPAFVGEVTA